MVWTAWNEEDDTTLRRLWEEGLTALKIMEAMPHRSRNAIIGRAHRLDLQTRVNPVIDVKESATLPMPMIRRLHMRLQYLALPIGGREGIAEAFAYTQTGTPGQIARALGVSLKTVEGVVEWLEAKYGEQAA